MISGVVLVRNQAEQLKKCLNALSFCDEIIVVDDNSTDDSAKIAEKAGARVYKRALNGDFAAQRNFGLEKTKNEWVLFVDADEIVTPELATELYQQTSQFLTDLNGFYLRRQDFMFGRKIKFGDAGNARLLRLAKKTKGEWVGRVHEKWNIVGEKGTLSNVLLHYPHQSIREFLSEINFYSSLRAKELYDQKKTVNAIEIIIYPSAKFVLNYIFKLGFIDGTTGIISALMMSFHSFLVRGKLWHLRQRKRSYEFGN